MNRRESRRAALGEARGYHGRIEPGDVRVHLRFYGCQQLLSEQENRELAFRSDLSLREVLVGLGEVLAGPLKTDVLDHSGLKPTVALAVDGEIVGNDGLERRLGEFAKGRAEVVFVFFPSLAGAAV